VTGATAGTEAMTEIGTMTEIGITTVTTSVTDGRIPTLESC
jgi:hypothetical protein